MPLTPGNSQNAISKNIGKLRSENYPEKQAVAIAFSEARRGDSDWRTDGRLDVALAKAAKVDADLAMNVRDGK
jgi:hypothetical protein